VTDELAGRTALITGGSRGLGLEIARHYLRAGASGVCICGRDPGAVDVAREELEGLAGAEQEVLARVADVSSPEDVASLVGATLERFPELTILVNNAGIYGPKGTIEQVDWREWAQAIETNLFRSQPTSSDAATARSSSSPEAARRGRYPVSAPTPPPRRRWCASRRPSPRSCARIAST
jgi:NAD(P)-dependent dehydrogenase (short-subunit alcohol dehydrogenase family)